MVDLFRRCPSCGRRFVLRERSRKLVDAERDTERVIRDVVVVARGPRDARLVAPSNATTVEEIPITRQTFEVGYNCIHCHHS